MNDLHDAAKRNDIGFIRRLLSAHIGLDMRDEYGWTPLLHSVALGHLEIARLLLSAGARADVLDGSGCTAIDYAVLRGDAEMIDALKGRV